MDDTDRIMTAARDELDHVRDLWQAHLAECLIQRNRRVGTPDDRRCGVCESLARHLGRCEDQIGKLAAPAESGAVLF